MEGHGTVPAAGAGVRCPVSGPSSLELPSLSGHGLIHFHQSDTCAGAGAGAGAGSCAASVPLPGKGGGERQHRTVFVACSAMQIMQCSRNAEYNQHYFTDGRFLICSSARLRYDTNKILVASNPTCACGPAHSLPLCVLCIWRIE